MKGKKGPQYGKLLSWPSANSSLGQNPETDVFELDWGAFGLEAEVAVGWLAIGSAGNLLAVDPEADLTVDGADVVVIPLVDPIGEALGWETACSVGGDGWEGFHFGGAGGEDITMGGEPIGWFAFAFLPVGLVAEIEDLDFDAIWKAAFSGGELFDGGRAGPSENTRVSSAFGMHPLAHQFEILDRFF